MRIGLINSNLSKKGKNPNQVGLKSQFSSSKSDLRRTNDTLIIIYESVADKVLGQCLIFP